jgi:DNA-binding NarL/FixJ family response regulator
MLARAGVMMRTAIGLPYPVMVRDRSVLYVPHPDPAHPRADWLERVCNVVLARSLAVAFDTIWLLAGERPGPAAQRGVDPEQHAIVRVLSDGLTDEIAAGRLHMSRRTFARRVAATMDSLDASSRFQAGAQAARRGWV